MGESASLTPPGDIDSEVFYFNSASGESSWVDPRMSSEFTLLQQHGLVSKVLADHVQLCSASPHAATCDTSDSDSDSDSEAYSDVSGHGSAPFHERSDSEYKILCQTPIE